MIEIEVEFDSIIGRRAMERNELQIGAEVGGSFQKTGSVTKSASWASRSKKLQDVNLSVQEMNKVMEENGLSALRMISGVWVMM